MVRVCMLWFPLLLAAQEQPKPRVLFQHVRELQLTFRLSW